MAKLINHENCGAHKGKCFIYFLILAVLAINQLMHKILFYSKFIIHLYMF